MSWVAVAKKDFQDAARSKLLWATMVLFVLFAAGLAYLYAWVLGQAQEAIGLAIAGTGIANIETVGFVWFMSTGVLTVGPVLVFVPIIGLLLGHKAIVGERDTGQIKLLLSLPHSRLDVVLGKFAGRSAVALVSVLAGFLLAAVIVAVELGLAPVVFVQFVLAVALFALVHISIGIGISSAAPSGSWAVALTAAFVTVFQVCWGAAFFVAELALFPNRQGTPEWFRFLQNLSPGRAYGDTLRLFIPQFAELNDQIAQAGAGVPNAQKAFFLQNWFGFLVLLAWGVLPIALGYFWFDSSDLS